MTKPSYIIFNFYIWFGFTEAVEKQFYSPFNTLTVIGITVSGIFLVLFVILITMFIKWRQSGKKKISNNRKINSQQTPTHTFKEILPDAYDEIKENQVGFFRSSSQTMFKLLLYNIIK